MTEPYYREDLARVHHLGFTGMADMVAPGGVIGLLGPPGDRVVVELGCGSGALTRHQVAAGFSVLASDASPAMVELARSSVPEAKITVLRLPDDPVPKADALVAVGHVFNYVADLDEVQAAMARVSDSVRSAGLIITDLIDPSTELALGEERSTARVEDDWAIFSKVTRSAESILVREVTTFVRGVEGWRRDDEHHRNLLFEPDLVAAALDPTRWKAEIVDHLGGVALPAGLKALVATSGV